MRDDIFFGIDCYGSTKSIKYHSCRTPGFDLWVAIYGCKFYILKDYLDRDDYKSLYRSFPYEINPNCKCKKCRYRRIFK